MVSASVGILAPSRTAAVPASGAAPYPRPLFLAVRSVYARSTVAVAEALPVGRGVELGRLTAVLDRLGGESGVCVAVEGDAGIGKSRLLRALSREARERGYLVLSGSASEYESDLPFGVWVDALDGHVVAGDRAGESPMDEELLGDL